MNLKQSIVVVNEYSIKNKKGKGGSRGGTPGDYVLRYMARERATETLTPVKLRDTENFIMRYMARKEASEVCVSVENEKDLMREAQGLGGVAFGYGDVSLSDDKLRWASKDIQKAFDSGKTVMKTVLSFDENYLRESGLVDSTFAFQKNGDYRGNLDQMKLRMAIMNGLAKMGRSYDDLNYIGVIQVDTAHVHCHLAMVDKGRGIIMDDGTQKGKLSTTNKRDLRRGIDMFLDEKQRVAMMCSSITHDKRNALCFIKKFTHKTMDEQGTPQLLMACLPKDKSLWRASTNRKEMQKANSIVREYVTKVLEEPNSGYKEAMRDVGEYAAARTKREGLSTLEYRRLITKGHDRIVEDCMNGVYSVLRQIPEEELKVRTPLMDVMSRTYDDMASHVKDDPMVEFGFKLRSYSTRLDYHRKEMDKYHDLRTQYEKAESVSAASKPLYDFFKEEELYNQKVMSKYQHFLSFIPPKEKYEDEFNELMEYKYKIRRLKKLKDDPSVKRMGGDSAEDYGKRVYDMHGGRFAAENPQILVNRLLAMEARSEAMEDEFKMSISKYGLVFDGKGVKKQDVHDFAEVKALDLHHLSYDWSYDVIVSRATVSPFIESANERWTKYQGACEYLRNSDQEYMIDSFPNRDISLMKELADKMSQDPVLETNKVSSQMKHNGKTIPLGIDYNRDMSLAVKMTVQSIGEKIRIEHDVLPESTQRE